MIANLFPFPCKFEFGLLRLEVGRNCLSLSRRDRKYPHVTLFYEPRSHGDLRGYYWLHVTRRVRGREVREELSRWKPEAAKHFETSFKKVIGSRFRSVLRPLSHEQLADEKWILFSPNVEIVQVLVGAMLKGRTFIVERLADLMKKHAPEGPFWEAIVSSIVDPAAFPKAAPSAPYTAFRLDDNDLVAEQGFVYGYPLGDHGSLSWFLAPMNVFGMTPEELLQTVCPWIFDFMWKVADVLDLPPPRRPIVIAT